MQGTSACDSPFHKLACSLPPFVCMPCPTYREPAASGNDRSGIPQPPPCNAGLERCHKSLTTQIIPPYTPLSAVEREPGASGNGRSGILQPPPCNTGFLRVYRNRTSPDCTPSRSPLPGTQTYREPVASGNGRSGIPQPPPCNAGLVRRLEAAMAIPYRQRMQCMGHGAAERSRESQCLQV